MFFEDFWILMFLPVIAVLLLIRNKVQKRSGFLFSSDTIIKELKGTTGAFFAKNLYYLKMISLLLIVFAMARPLYVGETRIKKEGIAMMIALDCSSTMLAGDLSLGLDDMVFLSEKMGESKDLNRLRASLLVAEDFVEKRGDDMIGVVAFASSAFLVCPLTFDHEWLLNSMKRITVGIIRDGTAVGSGILSSLNSLKDIKAKSRVIILLTDGVNNYGQISPLTAAKAARALGIRIYTIGISSRDPFITLPVKDSLGRKKNKRVIVALDEEELKKIADTTGGEYFRAVDMKSLRESYDKIDSLERTELSEKGYDRYQDIFQVFLFGALISLLLEMVLSNTIFRQIP